MKISGVDIRPGNIIEYEGGIWRAVKIQHTQPGKGGAYMQVELKNLIDGRKNNVRFRSAETVERVRLISQENAQLRAELGSVKDRLANVERIVTDGSHLLDREISALRDRAN